METVTAHEPEIETQIDIYDPAIREVLLFQDGIQVKQQKQERRSHSESRSSSISKLPGIITDVALLQKRDGTFEYITAPIDANGQSSCDLSQVLKARVAKEYSSVATPLNLVAMTDGDRSIAHQLKSAFREELVMVLNWYHLCKKLRSMMSMIVHKKKDKAGKVIGSRRKEKGVDLTIGRRQKKKGISWRPMGSRGLAVLKVVELNNRWNQLWFSEQAV